MNLLQFEDAETLPPMQPREWHHRLALTGSIGWHWSASTKVDFGNAGYGSTWNTGPGMIYSWMRGSI